jgi:retron-type reverse transcriptase
MDHQRALNQLRSREFLADALNYAIFDRTNGDFMFDPLEIENARTNPQRLIDELMEELQTPDQFEPRTAFAFFAPKNHLCDRRLVYIPIKDLTVRYSMAMVFSEQIESEIHPHCFAYRRATGNYVRNRFTEEFSTGGWARFCQWQAEQSASNAILLRTDISSFYDSISHDYLIDAIHRHLALSRECPLMSLFQRLLQIPIIYYSPSSDQIEGPTTARQGLPIGDGVEGYLANLYLKDVDDAMIQAQAQYGRYVDDIRIFGNTRQQVYHQLRILQEQLLRKGLNLNSSKTRIAEDEPSRIELISQLYTASSGDEIESEQAGSVIQEHVDAPFEEFDRIFSEDQSLADGDDAKDFCKFLSTHTAAGVPLVALTQRQVWHVNRLREIIARWRGPTKHATWLLAQTAAFVGVPSATQARARTEIIEILSDDQISPYSRYRLLHHLVKARRDRDHSIIRLIDQFHSSEKQRIQALLPTFLAATAFELNLIALYFLKVLGRSSDELRALAASHCRRGCEPVRNALEAATRIPQTVTNSDASSVEPDAIPEPTS